MQTILLNNSKNTKEISTVIITTGIIGRAKAMSSTTQTTPSGLLNGLCPKTPTNPLPKYLLDIPIIYAILKLYPTPC